MLLYIIHFIYYALPRCHIDYYLNKAKKSDINVYAKIQNKLTFYQPLKINYQADINISDFILCKKSFPFRVKFIPQKYFTENVILKSDGISKIYNPVVT